MFYNILMNYALYNLLTSERFLNQTNFYKKPKQQ